MTDSHVRSVVNKYRVAVLTNIPAPYRLKLFALIALKHDLKVFFDGKTEPNRKWKIPEELPFPHEFLWNIQLAYSRRRNDAVPVERRYRRIAGGLLPALKMFRPDVVVTAEMGVRSLQAALYCRFYRVPMILWSEGTGHTEGWVSSLVQRFRRLLVSRADRFWTNGREAAELLRSYGAAQGRIDEGMIGSDTRALASLTDRRLPTRDHLRQLLGVSGTVFLFVGRFVKPKGLLPLLTALESLTEQGSRNFSILFVGGGPERRALESWRDRNVSIRTKIYDFQQEEALADLYAAADVFLLPTLDDNWSLVALEAAVAGLPQILSKFNGAASDLLAMGAQGVCVNPFETEKLASLLRHYEQSPPKRMSDNQRSPILEYYSSEALADRACRSIQKAVPAN